MSNADLGQFRPVEIEVPTVQPCQVPVYPAAGGVTVQNQDPTGLTTVDVSSSPVFATGTVRTLTPGTSAYYPVGPVWCRVTPGQATKPAAAIIIASPGQMTAPNTTFDIAPGEAVYVNLQSPSPGADWVYTLPSPLRLVSARAALTTSSAAGQRLPYLWQVVTGDTQPTAEVLLSPTAIPTGSLVVLNAVPGGTPAARETPRRPVTGTLGTAQATLYTGPTGGWFSAGQLLLDNTSAAAVSVTIEIAGLAVFQGTIASGSAVAVPIPALQAGDVLTGDASAASAVNYTLMGTENADNRRVVSVAGLLMPTGSSVQSATAGLQAADQWSDVQLAFTAS